MAEAEGDHTPITPPDTQPTPPGWVMLVETFPSVAFIVGDPRVAAEEVWRALLAGRIRSLRRRFLADGVEHTQLVRTFWRDLKLYATRDGRVGMRLAEGVDPSIVSGCVFYVWQADILKVWSIEAIPEPAANKLREGVPESAVPLAHRESTPPEPKTEPEPKTKHGRTYNVLKKLAAEKRLGPGMQPHEVRKIAYPAYRICYPNAEKPSPRVVTRAYEELCEELYPPPTKK